MIKLLLKYSYYLIESKEKPVPSGKSFSIIKNFTDTDSINWKKLRSPLEFQKVGIPFSEVFLLKGDQWNNKNKDIKKEILNDLNSICYEYPIIVNIILLQFPL